MNQANSRAETLVDLNEATCGTILVVEDDPSLREIIGKTLSMGHYHVLLAEDGKQALDILHKHSDISLLLSDVQMKPMDGHALLKICKGLYPQIPFVLMTAYGTVQNAVSALHEGAVDYLVKPFEHDELLGVVKQNLLNKDVKTKCDQSQECAFNGLIAVDNKSIQLTKVAKKVAETEVTVMISGESGVGKEVVSKFIHQNSSRCNGPFVAINCAAIPENMLESVLFGYEKGAYTGAYQSKAGKFEQAQGGTLLLDEITEMDLGLQAKLLRVLQEREVERLGGSKVIPLNVRILATTNRDLQQAVIDGKFREDLFYRLNVFPINIYPLRNRVDDILPLANMILNENSHSLEKPYFSQSAQRALKSHEWPGNVRELDNVIQRALILKTGSLVEEQDIKFEDKVNNIHSICSSNNADENDVDTFQDSGLNSDLRAREQDLIISALSTRDTRKEVAQKLGISPRTLRYKLARMRDAGIPLPA